MESWVDISAVTATLGRSVAHSALRVLKLSALRANTSIHTQVSVPLHAHVVGRGLPSRPHSSGTTWRTRGSDPTSALSAERPSLPLGSCSSTNGSTREKSLIPAPTARGDSGAPLTSTCTSEHTPGRSHTAVCSVRKTSLHLRGWRDTCAHTWRGAYLWNHLTFEPSSGADVFTST